MKYTVWALAAGLVFAPAIVPAQNCCAPAVPQQGVLGETVALPHTLEIALHYELLRSRGMYDGSTRVDDPRNTKSDWNRVTLTAGYGITRRLSISAVVPYTWKKKTLTIGTAGSYVIDADGIGDISCILRYSILARSFASFRELSAGVGVKFPTGAVDPRDFRLPEELWPGTGSWDFHFSLSYYQGFEPVDFIAGATYLVTTSYTEDEFPYEQYEFGNQFAYLLTSTFHVHSRLDVSAAFSGSVRGRDRKDDKEVASTGRHQVWLVSGLRLQVVPNSLGIQLFYEQPVYQHFDGRQIGSDFNIRAAVTYTLPLKRSDEEGD